MKYFLSVNYLEDKLHQKILGINIPTLLSEKIQQLQLISIGIVSEGCACNCCEQDGIHLTQESNELHCDKTNIPIQKEYYAICKDFDLKAAWNNKWLRENVLIPITLELLYTSDKPSWYSKHGTLLTNDFETVAYTYKLFKRLINKYGKTRKQIAEEIREFVGWKQGGFHITSKDSCNAAIKEYDLKELKPNDWYPTPEFYAYYADYDWVVFCWLFGRMIDLPKGFPMYCKDLKQELDRCVSNLTFMKSTIEHKEPIEWLGKENMEVALSLIKGEGIKNETYPKQTNEHNSLDNAKWNYELYKFILSL